MNTLPYLNVLEVDTVDKKNVSKVLVIDKDNDIKTCTELTTNNYGDLLYKPEINGVELNGNKTSAELGIGGGHPYLIINEGSIIEGDFDEVCTALSTGKPVDIYLKDDLLPDSLQPAILAVYQEEEGQKFILASFNIDGSWLPNSYLWLCTITKNEVITETDKVNYIRQIDDEELTQPQINRIAVVTQAEYDSLEKSDNILYLVK